MSSDGGITFKDVAIAVDSLIRQNKPVSIAAIRRFIGRGDRQRIKMLWRLLNEPAINRLSAAEASDKLIATILSENLRKNAGVPGQLVEILDAINELQDRMDETFSRASQVLSLAHTIIMVNVHDISELSDLQHKLKKEIADLKYLLENKESK
ncbi:DNA-binding protein [Pseudomonas sp. NPDC087697]|uniref:DNA-binding protein n=1 Tax=Pseudomonas sp. NPDC087697 TaxID=3364447 RepID=UPI003814DDB4